ncbi:MAG: topoisomerase DNA-binding C4 zinc finger domain-containing protein, partial [Deltaproteobacteria bacterium]
RHKLYRQLDDIDPICPNCGSKMIEREGRYGNFYGCSRYPKCEATMKISDDIKKQKKEISSKIEKIK